MSFKRDGDDKSALSNQRRKRVAELLHEDIEEDELSRLRNGRYMCKLCAHGPIFDTLDMFYVHKQGKKHQLSIQYAEQQKQELWDLIQKRKHEKALTDGTVVTEQVDRVCEAGVKKQRRKPYDRKTVLDVNFTRTSDSLCSNTNTASCSDLPGNRQSITVSKSSQNKSSFHSNSSWQRNSNINGPKSRIKASYDTQSDTVQGNGKVKWKGTGKPSNKDNVMNVKDVRKMVGLSNSEQKNKFYLARKCNFSNNDDHMESCNKDSSPEGTSNIVSPNQVWEYYKDNKPRNSANIKLANQTNIKLANQTENHQDSSSKIVTVTKHNVCSDTEIAQVNKEKAEKMIHAFGSGWKKDWDGKWIKDEDVEFDSDEEPPEII